QRHVPGRDVEGDGFPAYAAAGTFIGDRRADGSLRDDRGDGGVRRAGVLADLRSCPAVHDYGVWGCRDRDGGDAEGRGLRGDGEPGEAGRGAGAALAAARRAIDGAARDVRRGDVARVGPARELSGPQGE